MFEEYQTLFPPSLPPTLEGLPKSIQIDELIFDNTFCDPIFKFPERSECVQMVLDIIEKHLPCEVFLQAYTAGKEELLIEISQRFDTQVWVDEDRFTDMKQLGLAEYFTLDKSVAWVFLNLCPSDDPVQKEALYDHVIAVYPRERRRRSSSGHQAGPTRRVRSSCEKESMPSPTHPTRTSPSSKSSSRASGLQC
jgi:hypothetical protein